MGTEIVATLSGIGRQRADLTRATAQGVNRAPAHIECAILSFWCRLATHAIAETRYTLTGASAIYTELKALGCSPLPSLRTSN